MYPSEDYEVSTEYHQRITGLQLGAQGLRSPDTIPFFPLTKYFFPFHFLAFTLLIIFNFFSSIKYLLFSSLNLSYWKELHQVIPEAYNFELSNWEKTHEKKIIIKIQMGMKSHIK